MKVLCKKSLKFYPEFKEFRVYTIEAAGEYNKEINDSLNEGRPGYLKQKYYTYQFGRWAESFYLTPKEFTEHFVILNNETSSSAKT